MAGQHDAALDRVAVPRGQRREQVRLAPVVVERQRGFDAVRCEIVAHPVDQREIRIAARRVERDQRPDQRPRDEIGRGACGDHADRESVSGAFIQARCPDRRAAKSMKQDRQTQTHCQTTEGVVLHAMSGERNRRALPCRHNRSLQRRPDMMTLSRQGVIVAATVALPCGIVAAQATLPLDTISLPPGFAIELVARVPNARAMAWGANGTLFVGSTAGKVYAVTLPPAGTKGEAAINIVASGLSEPAASRFATARSTFQPSIASCASTTSSGDSPIRRARRSHRSTPGRSPSRPQVHRVRPRRQALCPSVRRAMSASPIPRVTRTSRG